MMERARRGEEDHHKTSTATDTPLNLPDAILDTHLSQSSSPVVPTSDLHDEGWTKQISLNVPDQIPSSIRSVDAPASSSSDSVPTISTATSLTSQLPDGLDEFVVPASSRLPPLLTPLTPPSELSEDGFARPTHLSRRTKPVRSHVRSQTLAHATYTATPPLRATSPSETTAPPDFLTLLAGQERRVLELKEELHRAESDLNVLKKQWAVHEANKKKGELRNGGVVKMDMMQSHDSAASGHPVQPRGPYIRGHGRSATLATTDTGLGLGLPLDEESLDKQDEITEEGLITREKRRSMIQERIRRRGTTMESGSSQSPVLGRRSSQRVFSGSKHTRTLSLLATTSKPATSRSSLDTAPELSTIVDMTKAESVNSNGGNVSDDQTGGFPSLTRTGSNFARELNFGRTYKELASAASKRSLPQSADVLMKHGKVVVDGVRDGLWNFFEDIRQATVGDEAARETDHHGDRLGDSQKKSGGQTPKKTPKSGAMRARNSKEDLKPSDHSFWKEFGLETPKGSRKNVMGNQTARKQDRINPDLDSTPKSAAFLAHKDPTTPLTNTGASTFPQGVTGDHVSRMPASTSHLVSQSNGADFGVQDVAPTRAFPNHAAKKDHHHSHSSTDSGDSRDSRNPPSLMSDSPTTTVVTNDTDVEDEGVRGEVEDDSWDWKDVDSPTRDRKKQSNLIPSVVGVRSKVDKNESLSGVQEGGREGSKEYDWHALTR